ncbi:MAG: hypothetical protein K2O33_09645, partial [Muribaculaceae bacterium]|nr:hypothetical protein [Muribaculaceae bacterium]
ASFHRYGYGEGEASAREGITRKWWQFWKK